MSVPTSYLEGNRRYRNSFEDLQLEGVLQGRLRRDGAIAELRSQLRVQLWSVNQRATEAEESPLLRFVTRFTSSEDFAEG
jgi:hypothetical protein